MTDDERSEEFVRFIKENREMILRILEEDDGNVSEDRSGYGSSEDYSSSDSHRRSDSDGRDPIEPVKEFVKEGSDRVLKVLADEEVQEHFITGCMELVKCLEAVIRAMPMSDEMRERVDNVGKARDAAVRKVAVAGAQSTIKDKVEKISVKKKVTDEADRVKKKVTDEADRVKEKVTDEADRVKDKVEKISVKDKVAGEAGRIKYKISRHKSESAEDE